MFHLNQINMKKHGSDTYPISPILRLKSQRATERACPLYRIGRLKGLLAQRRALLDQLAEIETAIAEEQAEANRELSQLSKAS